LNNQPSDVVEEILAIFYARGCAAYLGEDVSQLEHALQSAWAAEKAGATSAAIAAALLHDIGHLLHGLNEDCAEKGVDDRHEGLGADWLAERFGPEVVEPVRMHVDAKRYLCTVEPEYFGRLSPASILSLGLQGGPFSPEAADDFARRPFAQDAVALRRFDEEAKLHGLQTPALEHFRSHLQTAANRAVRNADLVR
jgi:phosphonate degradation associated HDIG domain protein